MQQHVEPEARPAARRGGRVSALLVVLVGAALWAVAPAPWPPGEGQLVLTLDDASHTVAVLVGDDSPATLALGPTLVELPGGLPLDEPIDLTVRLPADSTGIALTLELADGRVELLPVVDGSDADTVRAVRRPLGNAGAVLALLGVVVVLWISELIPLWATSLVVPVWLVVTGAEQAEPALAPFFHPVLALLLAGFLLAAAMREVGLDRTLATRVVAVAGGGPVRLVAGFAVTAAIASMFLSNTAAVAVLIPVALAVSEPLQDLGYRRTLVLVTAYAATIGGVGSAIGTPANLLAITFLEEQGVVEISFLRWFAFGLPMVALFVPVMVWWVLHRLAPDVDPERFAAVSARARQQAAGTTLDRDQVVLLLVLAAIVAGWATEPAHGIHIGVVALLGVVALAATGRIATRHLEQVSWASLLTFGGGLSLGLALTDVGVADWSAGRLGALADSPTLVAVAAVAATAVLLTTLASNTGSAAMLIPLSIPLAAVLGVDPVLLTVVVAIACSVDFALVIGTPPTMLAYATGLYSPRELLRVGGVLDLAGLALLVTVVTAVWRALGLVS